MADGAKGLIPRPKPLAAPRIAWIDHARGIAIVLVVYGHSFRGLAGTPDVAHGHALWVLDYLIYCVHMPLFFFLSGLFSARVLPLGAPAFWRGRMLPILWAYLLWMTVELLLLKLLAGSTNMGDLRIGAALYLYDPIAPFWFLHAILVCSLFTHLLLRFGRLPLLAAALAAFVAGQGADSEITRLTSWGLLYFATGSCCAALAQSPRFARMRRRHLVLLAAASGVVGFGLLFRQAGLSNRLAVPAALCGIVLVACAAERLQGWAATRPGFEVFGLLGRISLTVLVVHVLGTAGARIVLTRFAGVQDLGLLLVAGTCAGLAVPVAVQLAATRLGLLALLGLPDVPIRGWGNGRGLRASRAAAAAPPAPDGPGG